MKSRIFRSSFFAAVAVGLALVPSAASASGLTAGASDGSLTSRVAMTVPLTVSCGGPFWDPNTQQLIDEFVVLNVEQASGREIARGNAFIRVQIPQPLLFQCDGSNVTIPVSVLADPTGPPFHGGAVVVSGSVGADAGTSCGFPGCFFNVVNESATFGPQTIRVH